MDTMDLQRRGNMFALIQKGARINDCLNTPKLVLGEERGNREIYFRSSLELLGDHY